jgi:dihydroorotate dehydrogenase subfamily 2
MLYKYLLKPLLFRIDPELIHQVFVRIGSLAGRYRLTQYIFGIFYNYRGDDLARTIDGITYRTPIVLSAGFDYNGHLTRVLPSLGFGGVEIGSVTARPCAGNPRPRLTRLPHTRSIIVNKGLRNDGVDMIIERLKKTPRIPGFVIGISIARTNDASTGTLENSIADYCYSFQRLNEEHIGDYYTLNISCPNAFSGELFTDPRNFEQLLSAIKQIPCDRPIYIKLPINLAWDELKLLLDITTHHGINGVVIGNLNKDYTAISKDDPRPATYQGGLSGAPCQTLSTKLIKKTREYCDNKLTIIGCGGIMSPHDATEKIEAGADILQLITGMIYEGPGLIKKLCTEISRQK